MVNEYDDEPGLYLSEKDAELLDQLVEYNGKWYFPDEIPEIPNQNEEIKSKHKFKKKKEIQGIYTKAKILNIVQ